MKEFTLDLAGTYSADDFYEYLGEYISIPSYFGYNLDALWDLLTDVREETAIHIVNAEEARSTLPKFIRGLERIASRLDKEEENVRIVFE